MKSKERLNVVIVGTGYVGITTGLCLAYLGHKVKCVDKNPQIIETLRKGKATIYEPGIAELMEESSANITFTEDLHDALAEADVVVISVGTPPKENGDTDLTYVESVAREIGQSLQNDSPIIVVNKSTVPIGTARRVEVVIKAQLEEREICCDIFVVSKPEFLREGAALFDTFYPDRIVVGSDDLKAINTIRQLYAPLLEQTFVPPRTLPRPEGYSLPLFVTVKATSAELIKYASNTFLAMKISYINEMAGIADRVGADIREVSRGIGLDKRISPRFLNAGLGWGGSCFPKDTRAIYHTGVQYNYEMPLTKAAIEVNHRQKKIAIEKLQSVLKVIRGSTIGILGLAFKPNTDDIRESPAIEIISTLLDMRARVKAYDPIAAKNYQIAYPDLEVVYRTSVLDTAKGCDALVLVTDWEEFYHVNWKEIGTVMNQKVIIDGRNILSRDEMTEAGFSYSGFGC
jgi:UDPglucose 6-dehydrogenase